MPEEPSHLVAGRAVVARRALREIVRDAVLGSYGVTGLAEPTLRARLNARLGMGSRAIRVTVRPAVTAEVWLSVAYGVPVAEVARQVDSAVRYALERAIGRPVGEVAIHVQGLAGRPCTAGTTARATPATRGAGLTPASASPRIETSRTTGAAESGLGSGAA
jgi:uncharacterized alkaline shock family protein YloU